MTISILNIRTIELPSIQAFFNVELDFGSSQRITLYGLRVVKSKQEGETFIGFPQRKAEDTGKYYNHFYPSPALTELIHKAVTAELEEAETSA